jgi:hypothetical protein
MADEEKTTQQSGYHPKRGAQMFTLKKGEKAAERLERQAASRGSTRMMRSRAENRRRNRRRR